MTGKTKNNNDDKPVRSESDADAADFAKHHLRHEKDLNRAYPLDEKSPVLKPNKGD